MTRDIIYFAHGKESGPWGTKISAMAELARARGWAVESPDYRFSHDPKARAAYLLELSPATEGGKLVLVGSSMGGYVSAAASHRLMPRGLFLMAPALDIPGYELTTPIRAQCIEVVHGWRDEVIPYSHSVRFAHSRRAALHLLDADHGLTEQLAEICALFGRFLDRVRAQTKTDIPEGPGTITNPGSGAP